MELRTADWAPGVAGEASYHGPGTFLDDWCVTRCFNVLSIWSSADDLKKMTIIRVCSEVSISPIWLIVHWDFNFGGLEREGFWPDLGVSMVYISLLDNATAGHCICCYVCRNVRCSVHRKICRYTTSHDSNFPSYSPIFRLLEWLSTTSCVNHKRWRTSLAFLGLETGTIGGFCKS